MNLIRIILLAVGAGFFYTNDKILKQSGGRLMAVAHDTFISLGIGTLATTLLPVLLLVILGAAKKIRALPLFMGMLAFFVSQVLIRIPIVSMLSTQGWVQAFAREQFVLYTLILSFTAGLFEESARLIAAKAMRQHQTYKDAVSFGWGHGLCEVILLVGLSYGVLLGTGLLFDWQPELLPAGAAEPLLAQLQAITPPTVAAGVLERVSAVLFHIFASTLVFKGVANHRSFRYYLVAILAHTTFNMVGVLLAQVDIWLAEGAMLALAVLALVYTLAQKKRFFIQPKETIS
jgi:uncharacterized membrane protein YhfC